MQLQTIKFQQIDWLRYIVFNKKKCNKEMNLIIFKLQILQYIYFYMEKIFTKSYSFYNIYL